MDYISWETEFGCYHYPPWGEGFEFYNPYIEETLESRITDRNITAEDLFEDRDKHDN